MKKIIAELTAGKLLNKEEAREALLEFSSGKINACQMASFLTVYLMRPITGEELTGFRNAMIDLALTIDLGVDKTIDIVGTGGDGKNTFNISTTTSFVVAGAGYKVAKHGNNGVSSNCGSSNVLQHLGYRFTNDTDKLKKDMERANFCFMHAPLFHPAMKEVAPVRRDMGLKTFFNLLGPLVNPSQPRYQFSGVYEMPIVELYKSVFEALGVQYGVVYDLGGYDEVSLTSDIRLATNNLDRIMSPQDLEFSYVAAEALAGGDTVRESADILVSVLKNEASEAMRNVVLANAALAIQVLEKDKDYVACLAIAKESLESGKAYICLSNLLADS